MSVPMETGMPGAMEEDQRKGKDPEPRGQNPSRFFEEALGEAFGPKPPAPGGSGDPGPAAVTTAPAAISGKKKHIKKPEDFTDAKNWDKFKRQEFLYYEEYEDEFGYDESTRIRFDLSFFTGGLPEKFATNFIDQAMNSTRILKWGTFRDFRQRCEEAFQDTNKKTNAENQLTLLRQSSKTAEEFFQEFNQLAFAAGYTDTHHDDVLVQLLHEAIHSKTIDLIYSQTTLPANYRAWKTQILSINGLQRRRAEQKRSQAQFTPHRPNITRKPETPATVPIIKTGTGVTYGGQGMKMDLDKARAEGRCFSCGEVGHISCNCPKKKVRVRATTQEEQENQMEKGFQEVQQ